ncbi:MBL fold metallo-hydrolase [Candidatus Sulfidibacterium hydrothermale]|uniref:MBL fold metallo-hydrolase n=1 Tax=Candidatus Sulfidibacterium hydrothermale TaxID=2875962 RepID=UPI001F0A99F5|nr:MBL fold metallo-hydrolase [Candidatus Sulfidibacterium hydrothermale]UBM63082.1 MBL fold metallo-hydrolase [Candidatus Sulfidibacterium hydrothermale]
MKVTFLGTGTSQGVPVIACPCPVCTQGTKKDHRLRSSVHIEHHGLHLNIDAGPDFRYQLLRENIKQLDGVLITHCHKDHIAGLDDVRSFNYLYKMAMPIYALPRDIEAIHREFSYAFAETRYRGVPEFKTIPINHDPFYIKDLEIIPLPALHMKMEVLGFRIGDFSYLTDTNYIPGETLARMAGSKVIVINALRKKPHPSHFCLSEAIKALEFLRPEQGYITHISHLMGFHDEVEKELPDFIHLAYDRLTIEI